MQNKRQVRRIRKAGIWDPFYREDKEDLWEKTPVETRLMYYKVLKLYISWCFNIPMNFLWAPCPGNQVQHCDKAGPATSSPSHPLWLWLHDIHRYPWNPLKPFPCINIFHPAPQQRHFPTGPHSLLAPWNSCHMAPCMCLPFQDMWVWKISFTHMVLFHDPSWQISLKSHLSPYNTPGLFEEITFQIFLNKYEVNSSESIGAGPSWPLGIVGRVWRPHDIF